MAKNIRPSHWFLLITCTVINITVHLKASEMQTAQTSFNGPITHFIMIDAKSGKTIAMTGDCMTQESPCSTFKIALSLMGFDAGILMNEHEPLLAYQEQYHDEREVCRQSQTPKSWIKNSCIWYSREITKQLGIENIAHYLDAFSYGNRDFSGEPGKNNGLANAWLCSSLKISPLEQVTFIQKMLQGRLPICEHAFAETKKIHFLTSLPNGWQLYGKQGAGLTPDKSIGWFVGWVSHVEKKETFIFACLLISTAADTHINGNLANQQVVDFLESELKNFS